MIEKEFKNIVEEIKQQISSTQYEIFKNARTQPKRKRKVFWSVCGKRTWEELD